LSADVSVDAVMADLQGRVRDRLRERLLSHGAATAFEDPALFADVERLLQAAITTGDARTLLLPELLGDPDTWRLETAMRYQSHRQAGTGSLIVFVKRRLLMPVLRWMFEYSRDNFERQRRVNQVLFACVQELALETAQLRRRLDDQEAGREARRADVRGAGQAGAGGAEARGASEGG
jgi:hypothetical protein